jgi:hypothetical protein
MESLLAQIEFRTGSCSDLIPFSAEIEPIQYEYKSKFTISVVINKGVLRCSIAGGNQDNVHKTPLPVGEYTNMIVIDPNVVAFMSREPYLSGDKKSTSMCLRLTRDVGYHSAACVWAEEFSCVCEDSQFTIANVGKIHLDKKWCGDFFIHKKRQIFNILYKMNFYNVKTSKLTSLPIAAVRPIVGFKFLDSIDLINVIQPILLKQTTFPEALISLIVSYAVHSRVL